MTTHKLIARLLKFNFRCAGFAFRRDGGLDILVKHHKNGCRCPECGRVSEELPWVAPGRG